MPRYNLEYLIRLRNFAWDRAHKATSAAWRSRYFHAFDVFDGLRDAL